MKNFLRILICLFLIKTYNSQAQIVAGQKFGKNRLQFDTLVWSHLENEKFTFLYYDSINRDYTNKVSQLVLDEINNVQNEFDIDFTEHFNVLFYKSFEHYLQSNAALQLDWYNTSELTLVANRKIIIYYTSDTEKLRNQIRRGLTRIMLELILIGEIQGEQNQEETIDDMPKWFLYGLILYKSDGWNSDLDYKLRVILQDETYRKYKHFINTDPIMAGLTFWYFVERKYGIQTIDKAIKLLKAERNLNPLFKKIFGPYILIEGNIEKKVKLSYNRQIESIFPFFKKEKYGQIKNENTKGRILTTTNFIKEKLITLQANPVLKKGIYGIVEFKSGVYRVYVSETKSRKRLILKNGILLNNASLSQQYPLIAWDEDGINLGVVFYDKSFLHFFEYNVSERTKKNNINLSDYFTQIQDFKYIKNNSKLLLSAVKNGQSDIFTFDLKTLKIENITNDIYDDIDPSYVSFPGKVGIIFSSNRPFKNFIDSITKTYSTEIKKQKFTICLADYMVEENTHNITSLTESENGDLRYPSQLTANTFSYISDENGVKNRYVGNFFTKKEKLDTIYTINNKPFFNLSLKEIDSLKKEKLKIDKIEYALKSKDSSSTFPVTDYSRHIIESRNVSGTHPLLTDLKYKRNSQLLYKIDNPNDLISNPISILKPIGFRKKSQQKDKFKDGLNINPRYKDSAFYFKDFFISEFLFNKLALADTIPVNDLVDVNKLERKLDIPKISLLNYSYRNKFFILNSDVDILDNTLFGDKYQPYAGGQGPVRINNQGLLNATLKVSIADILENFNFTIGYRIPIALNISDAASALILDVNYLKYRTDFGASYYRNVNRTSYGNFTVSNYYFGKISYPFDILRKVNLSLGFRRDNFIYKYLPASSEENYALSQKNDSITWNIIFKSEYVYDNTIKPVYNISKGFKYKIYFEYFTNLTKESIKEIKTPQEFSLNNNTINFGFDARYYKSIYKNIIWATRYAGDFSFGNNRVIYYLGGADGDYFPKFNHNNPPNPNNAYSYQSLALNVRGFHQNASNGTNNFVINSEIRAPILSSIFNRPIGNSILRNLQFVSFIDIGTAWSGGFENIKPSRTTYTQDNVLLTIIGKTPLNIGYGIGFRTLISSYFIKLDIGYPVPYFFQTPTYYFSIGLDF